jgi:chaperonin GroEL
MDLKRGIEKAVAVVVEELKAKSKPIDGKDDIEKVATISGNNDPEIGKIISEVFDSIGKDGIISVEESNTIGLSKDITEGINFNRGLMSGYLMTDTITQKCELDEPVIIVTDKKIDLTSDIFPILKMLYENNKKNVLIIAHDFGIDALRLMVKNKQEGIMNIAAVMAPGFGEDKGEMLQDIAALTGATLISSEVGLELENFCLEMLGGARRVVSRRHDTTIIGAKGKKEDIKERETIVRNLIKGCADPNRKLVLTDRLSKITGGIGIIRVGAVSQIEMKERKYRIEDAVEATKAAIEEGIVAGGGVALFNIKLLGKVEYNSIDEAKGIEIIEQALVYPISNIISNAGKDCLAIPAKIHESGKDDYGYNVKTDEFGDMIEMGIIDPVKVTRCALENAASVAAQILTTNVLIVEEVQENV